MESAAHVTLPVLLADGGATRNDALMQMQADVLGRPVHRSTQEDLSARGAALLGGLALGWWRSLDELAALPKSVQPFEPRRSQADRERMRGAWRLAVARARLTVERIA
jgi:glycerol kinase